MSYSWGAARQTAAAPARRRRPEEVREDDPDLAPTQLRQTAAQLAPMVDVWERLIDEHIPNRSGRCRKCTQGGTGMPFVPWPCVVYGIAEMARKRHDGECR
jgi:hypothetical protein